MAIAEVKLNPAAYLKIILHTKRFWNEKIPDERRNLIYGVLIGYCEDDVRYILDYIPLFHSPFELDLEKKHSLFMKMDSLNQDLATKEVHDYIVGWVRSVNTDYPDITVVDKKNQIYLQTAYQEQAVTMFVLIPTLSYDFGISIRGFVDPISTLDNNSLLIDFDWKFDEPIDIDDLFWIVKDLYDTSQTNKPLIKEYKEVSIKIPR